MKMKKILTISLMLLALNGLTACYTAAVATAGAAGGYIAHENIDKD